MVRFWSGGGSSGIPEFVKAARTIRRHRDGITAALDRGLSLASPHIGQESREFLGELTPVVRWQVIACHESETIPCRDAAAGEGRASDPQSADHVGDEQDARHVPRRADRNIGPLLGYVFAGFDQPAERTRGGQLPFPRLQGGDRAQQGRLGPRSEGDTDPADRDRIGQFLMLHAGGGKLPRMRARSASSVVSRLRRPAITTGSR